MEGKLFCFICCSNNGTEKNGRTADNLQFKRFCKDLEQLEERKKNAPVSLDKTDEEDNEDEFVDKFIAESLQALLTTSPCKDKLSACSECTALIKSAMERKEMMEKVEERVRRLQMELLKELKGLQKLTNGFQGEMKKITEVVEKSDKDKLKGFIKKEGKGCGSWIMRDIGLFRKKILEASEVLGSHHHSLEVKTLKCAVPSTPASSMSISTSVQPTKQELTQECLYFPVKTEATEAYEDFGADDSLGDPLEDFGSCGNDDPGNEDSYFLDDRNYSDNNSPNGETDNEDDDEYIPQSKRRKKRQTTQPNKSAVLSVKGASQPPLEFILSQRRRKCVVLNDNLYLLHQKFKRSYNFGCFHKRFGCKGTISVVGYNEDDDTYQEYNFPTRHTINHAPHTERITKLKQKDWDRHDRKAEMREKRKALGRNRPKPIVSDKPLEFMTTAKGKTSLVLNDFVFHKHSDNQTSTYFTCGQRNRGCKSTITVQGYKAEDNSYTSYTQNVEHINHKANPEKLFKRKAYNRAREIVNAHLDMKTSHISMQVEKELGEGAFKACDRKGVTQTLPLSKYPTFKRIIRRTKMKMRDKRLICDECAEGFRDESSLLEHQKTHQTN